LEEAKVLTEVWRREYNQVRLHSSLGDWPEWRPDPDWTVPLLPDNWAEVPTGYSDE
jgi:transposase InsO family protein